MGTVAIIALGAAAAAFQSLSSARVLIVGALIGSLLVDWLPAAPPRLFHLLPVSLATGLLLVPAAPWGGWASRPKGEQSGWRGDWCPPTSAVGDRSRVAWSRDACRRRVPVPAVWPCRTGVRRAVPLGPVGILAVRGTAPEGSSASLGPGGSDPDSRIVVRNDAVRRLRPGLGRLTWYRSDADCLGPAVHADGLPLLLPGRRLDVRAGRPVLILRRSVVAAKC